ncbi:hypothetical protein P7K49_032182, partial [Saguinus oedipus]
MSGHLLGLHQLPDFMCEVQPLPDLLQLPQDPHALQFLLDCAVWVSGFWIQ